MRFTQATILATFASAAVALPFPIQRALDVRLVLMALS